MGKYDSDDYVYFDKSIAEQYFNIIGLDESELSEKIRSTKRFRLVSLSDLYESANAKDYLMTSSSKDVGNMYELLVSQLDNDLLYETQEEKDIALSSIYYLLSNISSIDVSSEYDSFTIFERTNSLLYAIMSGLLCSSNVLKLRMLYDNASPLLLINMAKKDREESNQVKLLYKLMALFKMNYSTIDYKIFNDSEEIDEDSLDSVLNELLSNNKNSCIEPIDNNKKILFRRPTYKVLKENESYN